MLKIIQDELKIVAVMQPAEELWVGQNMHGGMYTAHPEPEPYMGFQLDEATAPADFNPQGYQFDMHPAIYNEEVSLIDVLFNLHSTDRNVGNMAAEPRIQ